MSRLRVLQIVDNLGMGGAEAWLVALMRHWCASESGVKIDILATGRRPGVFDDDARALGATIFYLRYGQARLPAFARGFRRLLVEGRYDALHDHQDYASGWHLALGAGLLPPVRVTHVHNPAYQVEENYGRTLRGRLTRQFGKAMVARYGTYIAGTSRQAIIEHGFDAPAFDHIPKAALHCGFDPGPFAGDRAGARAAIREEFVWPNEARIVLFAGRIDVSPDPAHPRTHKNSGFAVSVAVEVCRRNPNLHFLFAGSPSTGTPILEKQIVDAGHSKRIRLLGIRNDIPRLMLACDVLFFPSRGEGLGMVAVEAQAAGLPVLASTEVPREAVVVPELVRFQNLDAGEERWVVDLLELAAHAPDVGNAHERVAASAFAIRNSANALAELYRGGTAA